MRLLHNYLLLVSLKILEVICFSLAVILSPLWLVLPSKREFLLMDEDNVIEQLEDSNLERIVYKAKIIRKWWKNENQ